MKKFAELGFAYVIFTILLTIATVFILSVAPKIGLVGLLLLSGGWIYSIYRWVENEQTPND